MTEACFSQSICTCTWHITELFVTAKSQSDFPQTHRDTSLPSLLYIIIHSSSPSSGTTSFICHYCQYHRFRLHLFLTSFISYILIVTSALRVYSTCSFIPVYFYVIWENTALVQLMRREPFGEHLIHWTYC